jgi:hypothetical protein
MTGTDDGPILHPSQWSFSLFMAPKTAAGPNSGTTMGILPVFLFTNELTDKARSSRTIRPQKRMHASDAL